MVLVLQYNDTCFLHIIMVAKLIHHGGQIIYIYIYIFYGVTKITPKREFTGCRFQRGSQTCFSFQKGKETPQKRCPSPKEGTP